MYICANVERVDQVCEDITCYTLELERPLKSKPGQFVMLWVPRVGEIPLSVAFEEGERIQLLVAKKGKVTTYIHKHVVPGCKLFLRGPLGRGFRIEVSRALVIGGGVGVAPLLYLCKVLKEHGARVTVALGYKSASYTPFLDRLSIYADELNVATEDGSLGVRGTAVDLSNMLIRSGASDIVYTCGKELMMKRVVEIATERGVRVEASLERFIKCGIGICGTCALEPLGLRVCLEGPVFDGETLMQLEDFGRWWRDAAGRRVSI